VESIISNVDGGFGWIADPEKPNPELTIEFNREYLV